MPTNLAKFSESTSNKAAFISSRERRGFAISFGLLTFWLWIAELSNFFMIAGLLGNKVAIVSFGILVIDFSIKLNLCTLSTTISPTVWGIESTGKPLTIFCKSIMISSIVICNGFWSSLRTSILFVSLLRGNLYSGLSIILFEDLVFEDS